MSDKVEPFSRERENNPKNETKWRGKEERRQEEVKEKWIQGRNEQRGKEVE